MTGKISDLTPAAAAATTDVFEIERPGSPNTSLSVTGTQLRTMATAALSTVASSGAYSDLTGKPSLATVATSGAYSDLTGAPTILKTNVTTIDPGVSNDGTQGYAPGSVWLNTTSAVAWRCNDSSTGAAKWFAMDFGEFPGYVTANWYVPFNTQIVTGTAVAASVIRMIPWIPKSRVTISTLGLRCTTLAAGGNCQLAIYASDLVTKRPTGSALSSTASISLAASGSLNAALGSNVSADPGKLYWLAFNSDNSTAVFATNSQTGSLVSDLLGSATQTNAMSTVALTGVSTPQTFASGWPDVTSATWTEQSSTTQAMIMFKVASVP